MSLTPAQQAATKRELQASLALVDLTVAQVAEQLEATPAQVEQTLKLAGNIHNPWIVKEHLAKVARQQGKTPIEFSALRGNYRNYWFLNASIIESGRLI